MRWNLSLLGHCRATSGLLLAVLCGLGAGLVSSPPAVAGEETPEVAIQAPARLPSTRPGVDFRVTVKHLGRFEKTVGARAKIRCNGIEMQVDFELDLGEITVTGHPMMDQEVLNVSTVSILLALEKQIAEIVSVIAFWEDVARELGIFDFLERAMISLRIDALEQELAELAEKRRALAECLRTGFPAGSSILIGIVASYTDVDGNPREAVGTAEINVVPGDPNEGGEDEDPADKR